MSRRTFLTPRFYEEANMPPPSFVPGELRPVVDYSRIVYERRGIVHPEPANSSAALTRCSYCAATLTAERCKNCGAPA